MTVITSENLVTANMEFHVIFVAIMNVKPNPSCLNIVIKLMSLVLKNRLSKWLSTVAVSEIQVESWVSIKRQ